MKNLISHFNQSFASIFGLNRLIWNEVQKGPEANPPQASESEGKAIKPKDVATKRLESAVSRLQDAETATEDEDIKAERKEAQSLSYEDAMERLSNSSTNERMRNWNSSFKEKLNAINNDAVMPKEEKLQLLMTTFKAEMSKLQQLDQINRELFQKYSPQIRSEVMQHTLNSMDAFTSRLANTDCYGRVLKDYVSSMISTLKTAQKGSSSWSEMDNQTRTELVKQISSVAKDMPIELFADYQFATMDGRIGAINNASVKIIQALPDEARTAMSSLGLQEPEMMVESTKGKGKKSVRSSKG